MKLSLNDLKEVLEETFDLSWDEIIDGSRLQERVYARYLFAVEASATGMSMYRIGRELGQYDHASAYYYLNNYDAPRWVVEKFKTRFEELKALKLEDTL